MEWVVVVFKLNAMLRTLLFAWFDNRAKADSFNQLANKADDEGKYEERDAWAEKSSAAWDRVREVEDKLCIKILERNKLPTNRRTVDMVGRALWYAFKELRMTKWMVKGKKEFASKTHFGKVEEGDVMPLRPRELSL